MINSLLAVRVAIATSTSTSLVALHTYMPATSGWVLAMVKVATHHLAIPYSIHRLHQHTGGQSLWTIPSEHEPRDVGSGETFSHTCEGSTVWGDHRLIHRGCGDIRTNCKMEIANIDWHITCQCIYTYLAR